MSFSVHANNMTKKIFILGEGITQGLDDTTLTVEKMYSINFTASNKKLCLSFHYNGANSYLFLHGKEIAKFKAKDSEIVANPLCLGNISEDFSERFSITNMKKAGLYYMILVLIIGLLQLMIY